MFLINLSQRLRGARAETKPAEQTANSSMGE
jgi:hypothetical protein